jgi:hypothetical protein
MSSNNPNVGEKNTSWFENLWRSGFPLWAVTKWVLIAVAVAAVIWLVVKFYTKKGTATVLPTIPSGSGTAIPKPIPASSKATTPTPPSQFLTKSVSAVNSFVGFFFILNSVLWAGMNQSGGDFWGGYMWSPVFWMITITLGATAFSVVNANVKEFRPFQTLVKVVAVPTICFGLWTAFFPNGARSLMNRFASAGDSRETGVIIASDKWREIDGPLKDLVIGEFPSDTIMWSVVACETGFRHSNADGSVIVNSGSSATGLTQIMKSIHGADATKLGYNIDSVAGNISYAKMLRTRNGYLDWTPSEHCWNKAYGSNQQLATSTRNTPAVPVNTCRISVSQVQLVTAPANGEWSDSVYTGGCNASWEGVNHVHYAVRTDRMPADSGVAMDTGRFVDVGPSQFIWVRSLTSEETQVRIGVKGR